MKIPHETYKPEHFTNEINKISRYQLVTTNLDTYYVDKYGNKYRINDNCTITVN